MLLALGHRRQRKNHGKDAEIQQRGRKGRGLKAYAGGMDANQTQQWHVEQIEPCCVPNSAHRQASFQQFVHCSRQNQRCLAIIQFIAYAFYRHGRKILV